MHRRCCRRLLSPLPQRHRSHAAAGSEALPAVHRMATHPAQRRRPGQPEGTGLLLKGARGAAGCWHRAARHPLSLGPASGDPLGCKHKRRPAFNIQSAKHQKQVFLLNLTQAIASCHSSKLDTHKLPGSKTWFKASTMLGSNSSRALLCAAS